MNTLQLREELLLTLSPILDDESAMSKVIKYIKRIASQKTDDAAMTKEEFEAKIKLSEQQYRNGEYYEMLPDEDVVSFLKRTGADV